MTSSNHGNNMQYSCNFCGKNQNQVVRLIAGPGSVYICNECVDLCQEIISEESIPTDLSESPENARLLTPQELKAKLDEYIVGQDYTKRILSVAVYNHFKRVSQQKKSSLTLDKSNVLLIGPTGTGKTLSGFLPSFFDLIDEKKKHR